MSSDIPVILATDPGARDVVFMSAATGAQMQQYAVGGWRVFAANNFTSGQAVDLASIPAKLLGTHEPAGAAAVSIEGRDWSEAVANDVSCWNPVTVKVNFAFDDDADRRAPQVAAFLRQDQRAMIAIHWRDDNTMRLRNINRIDLLDSMEPPEWNRLDLIACNDAVIAERILRIGVVHAAHERRAAELRLNEELRASYIAKLEDALQTLQGRAPNGSK
ncbi:MAG: hypothetical protein KDE14_12965 [Rhodobacteraceae bacterium]|nr:hypothetical protein [Paracoccaceae bacterium]